MFISKMEIRGKLNELSSEYVVAVYSTYRASSVAFDFRFGKTFLRDGVHVKSTCFCSQS